MESVITSEEYIELLKKHDWYYSASDDPRVYDIGHNERSRLKNLARNNPNFRLMYDSEEAIHFGKISKRN